MSIEKNKQVVTDLYREIFGRGDMTRLPELVSEDFANRDTNAGQPSGRDGIAHIARLLREAISGFECVIHDLIAEGDQVVASVTFQGIHAKDFLGIRATNQFVRNEIIAIWRLREGRIVGLHAMRRWPGEVR